MLRSCAGLGALFVLALPSLARGAVPGHSAAVQSTNPPDATWTGFAGAISAGTAGWVVHVGPRALEVDHLGLYDAGGGGLAQAHQVGLWRANGTLITSVTVRAGTAAQLVDGYRYESITPVTLAAGTDYVLGAFYGSVSGDPILYGAQQTLSPLVSFGMSRQSVLSPGASFGYLSIDAGLSQGIFGPNFLFADEADLALTGTATRAPALAGQPQTWIFSLENAGPNDALQASIAATLPPGATFVRASASPGWTVASPTPGATGSVSATAELFAVGSTAELRVTATVDAATPAHATLTCTATAAPRPMIGTRATTWRRSSPSSSVHRCSPAR